MQTGNSWARSKGGPPKIRNSVFVGRFSHMRKFYFDFYGDGTTIDEIGEEFPTVDEARKGALVALADSGRDFARRFSDGRMAVLIRDGAGPMLEVSATFETKRIRPR
jgi:hypothetical protein